MEDHQGSAQVGRIGGLALDKLHEGAHHVDGHLDRARAVEHGRGHDRPMLRERVGQVFAMLAAPSF